MRLTLLVPELFWPEPADQTAYSALALPGLEWLLARGKPGRTPARPAETALAAGFGLDEAAPFGPLRLLGESFTAYGPNPRESHWLCADPVHLRFHHERIVLADAGAFDLSDDEAHALAIGLNREFADIGEFHVATARRWYLRLEQPLAAEARPLSAVAGRSLDRGAAAPGSKLQKWLNEIQMFLHGHPVNARREAAGQPAVNSLWLWGSGALPGGAAPPGGPAFAAVWADAPLARGLARWAGAPLEAAPAGLEELLRTAPRGDHLVVLDALLPPVLYEDAAGWRAAVQRLDADWFVPLRRHLGRNPMALTLVAPTVFGLLTWQWTGAGRWKFWLSSRPLTDLARELAA